MTGITNVAGVCDAEECSKFPIPFIDEAASQNTGGCKSTSGEPSIEVQDPAALSTDTIVFNVDDSFHNAADPLP